MKKSLDNNWGKSGKESIRLANCIAKVGKVFEGRQAFSSNLQDVKGKTLTLGGKSIGTMRTLGAIDCGAYKGKGKIMLKKDAEGKDRIDFFIQLLDASSDKIKWADISPVGSLSK